jgi:hypothetical protein
MFRSLITIKLSYLTDNGIDGYEKNNEQDRINLLSKKGISIEEWDVGIKVQLLLKMIIIKKTW